MCPDTLSLPVAPLNTQPPLKTSMKTIYSRVYLALVCARASGAGRLAVSPTRLCQQTLGYQRKLEVLVLCSLTLCPIDAEPLSGHTQAGLRPGNVQELHGTAYPTPVLATNDGFSRAG